MTEWTLIDETLWGISFKSRKPNRARDAEDLIDYLITIGMNISEDNLFLLSKSSQSLE